MGKYKEQLILFLNKIKNNRSLQVKIALIVGVLLLYHFIFGDIGNRNIEIESITLENPFIGVYPPRDAVFSVSLKNDKLQINKFSKFEIDEKYCKSIEGSYKLNKVISFYPIIVECEPAISVVDDVIITNGKWMQFAKHKNSISGQNEKYLLREDYSLINKITGEITENKITSSANGRRLHINGVATLSENMRYFITPYSKSGDSIAEIDKLGGVTILHKFTSYLLFKRTNIVELITNENGNYIFMIVKKRSRSPADLLFYIIDVKNKAILYRKTLEQNQQGYYNIYINSFHDNILFIYESISGIHAYKVVLKNK